MFDFLFNYPLTVFSKGDFVLLGRWPVWVLLILILGAAAFVAVPVWKRRMEAAPSVRGVRTAVVCLLQISLIALLLLLLWQPAISVATLKPQQNVIAVLVDDSHSMSIVEDGTSRSAQAVAALNNGVLDKLGTKFQVRTYRIGEALDRIESLEQLNASARATRIGEGLKQVMAEASSLPIGAVVLLSDGAENSGGIDLETLSEIRQRRIPVHTVGFGREQFERDLEITDVQLPARALADSRLSAQVSLRQTGYSGKKARLSVRDGSKVLASQEITLKADGAQQTETILFNAGVAGARTVRVSVDPLPNEENPNNNAVTRLVNVEAFKPRILYIEGEPRWEFKFIRRAIEEDRSLHIVSMLRTTQNKIYRQGIGEPKELELGFPATREELFNYQAIIIGSVEANYFTPTQQELLQQFVDRRGGGVLFLAGRSSLADGGYANTPIAEILPVTLPNRKGTFHREPAFAELTQLGRESVLCRLEEDADKNAQRWKELPHLADYQEIGTPKPAAVVLAELSPASKGRLPLLVTQPYGRGRVGVLATSGTWRWQMTQDLADQTHEMFWQQLLRWLVSDSPGRVLASIPQQVLSDDHKAVFRVEVRDRNYAPVSDARVEARILGPEGLAETVELSPDPLTQGLYTAEWTAVRAGSYLAEVLVTRGSEDLGRDVLTFRREDGVAENFRAEQNRELLEKLASQTGGRYWKPSELRRLGDEVSYSEAGITVRETKDLWNMPIVFLLVIALRSAEWLLRRKWGVV